MYINWQELRAAKSAGSGNVMQLYLDNMTAIAFIRRMGGTHSSSLCKESQNPASLAHFRYIHFERESSSPKEKNQRNLWIRVAPG